MAATDQTAGRGVDGPDCRRRNVDEEGCPRRRGEREHQYSAEQELHDSPQMFGHACLLSCSASSNGGSSREKSLLKQEFKGLLYLSQKAKILQSCRRIADKPGGVATNAPGQRRNSPRLRGVGGPVPVR